MAVALAQAVSSRYSTAAARAHGICGGLSGTGAGFLRVLRFPLPILIPPTAPYSLIILSPALYSLDTHGAVK
jgi:hypothetical protein